MHRRRNAVAHLLHSSVNRAFPFPGKTENACDSLYRDIPLLWWSGTEPAVSLRSACILVCLVLSVSYVFVQPRLCVVTRTAMLSLLLTWKSWQVSGGK